MENLHELEIAVLMVIQALGAWLEGPLQAFSLLGNEEFFLVIMPILYWCLNAVLGLRVAMMLILSNGLVSIIKIALHQPRPYWIDLRILPRSEEFTFGLPSGHAMNAASVWGLVIVSVRKNWALVGGLLIIFLIGFSRLYLGMHFISDVVVGWILGGLLLFAFLRVEASLKPWLIQRSLREHILLALASAFALSLVFLITRAALGSWQLPTSWTDTVTTLLPEGEPIDPLNLEGAFTLSGTWFGMLTGAAWMFHTRGGFNVQGTVVQRLLRYPVGLVGVLIFWYGLGQVFPDTPDALSYLLRFLRYTLVGLWVSAAAPLIFERIGLARRDSEKVPSFSANQNPL